MLTITWENIDADFDILESRRQTRIIINIIFWISAVYEFKGGSSSVDLRCNSIGAVP